MSNNCAVILAAGEGKRMKSKSSKVLSKVLFKPMINWVADAVESSGTTQMCLVIGHSGEMVKEHMGDKYNYAVQAQRLGTGHAVMQAVDFIKDCEAENVLILNGDAPLIDKETISGSLKQHEETGSAVTLVSACIDNPTGYGRIVRDKNGDVVRIVEQKDATDEQKEIKEVNSGVFWFKASELLDALTKITPNNSQGEYYLTDTLEIIMKKGLKASAYITDNNSVVLGANDRVQLNQLNEIARKNILNNLMISGVEIPCLDGIIVGPNVKIGMGTVLLPNSIIRGNSSIGENCEIGPNTLIDDSEIKDSVELNNVFVESSLIENGANMGPFDHIRPNCHIGENVHVGNYVEVKNSNIGKGTKLPHLTYVGDSDIGEGVNFGCGSLTVNYDGKIKSRTTVEDHAFIGCNTNLIAPVTVGEYAFTAAGSTVTKNVPAYSLCIARSKQTNKEDWVKVKKPYKGME